MATSMAVDTQGSVEKRMNMSLDDIIKESSNTRKTGASRGKGISVGGNRVKGSKGERISAAKSGAGRVLTVPRPKFAERRQNTIAKRRGLQATAGQQARKALRPQAPIKKAGGRAPLRISRGGSGQPRREPSNITVSIQNNRMRSSGSGGPRRPVIPTAASTLQARQPRQQAQQQRYQQPAPYVYQQPVYASQAPTPYYGQAQGRGGGLAPLAPSYVEPVPLEYRPARRSELASAELPSYAQHDYRDAPPPNYEMEGGSRGGMHADREYRHSQARTPSLSGYTSQAERMHYTGPSAQRRNTRGYIMPGP